MKIISSHETEKLSYDLKQQAYNTLDCCVPMEVLPRLWEAADEDERRAYAFDRAMQGPAFTMAVRGICVDEEACAPAIADLRAKETRCAQILDRFAEVWEYEKSFPLTKGQAREMEKVWGVVRFNPLSPQQVKHFLYDVCREKPYHNRKAKGEDTTTVGEDALRDISIRSPLIGTIATTVLRARELRKAIGFINARRSPDGKLRCSFNVGATKFGRWSSSQNCYKDGLNFFNLPREARRILVPSKPSRVMVNIDLKQAESNIVAHIAKDVAYIQAHQSGNVHTAVACDVLGLTPEEVKAGGKDTGSPYWRAKRLQHGTNYGLGERHAARIMGVKVGLMRKLRRLYFTKYRGVARRIERMSGKLRQDPRFLFFTGRPHLYMGHWNDHEVIKSALSGEPQGGVADILNIALYRLWKKYDDQIIWLLNTNYDSILFETEKEGLDETLRLVKEELNVPVTIEGRTVTLGCDIGVGKNWKEASA